MATRYRLLRNRSVEQLRQIQMIYQMADIAMNPRHTVREIIGRRSSSILKCVAPRPMRV